MVKAKMRVKPDSQISHRRREGKVMGKEGNRRNEGEMALGRSVHPINFVFSAVPGSMMVQFSPEN